MVVPTFVEQALLNQPITIFGNGMQTRSFCNAEDVVHGIQKLIETKDAYGEIFNVGATERITILDLALYIKSAIASKSNIIHLPFPEQRASGRDILHRCANIDKIKSFIGWEPRTPWKQTIQALISAKRDSIQTLNVAV